ncbi:MAG TPA: universal stress protein [Pseudonocardiaceae bacterium]
MDPAATRGAVVAGYDGSEPARRAARWAVLEAALRRRPLLLVAAFSPPRFHPRFTTGTPTSKDVEQLRQHVEESLQAIAEECRRSAPGVEVHTVAVMEHPVTALTRHAEDAELLVVGASGATALRRLTLGSTTSALVRHVQRPVVVVRDTPDDTTERRRVLVGVDEDPSTDAAVGFAFDFASRHGYDLQVVHVWNDLPFDALAPVRLWDFDWKQVNEQATRLLTESVSGWQERYPEVRFETENIASGHPAAVLLERSSEAALLVVGSHHTPLERALIGSVSHAVLHHASCPVAVVRSGAAPDDTSG